MFKKQFQLTVLLVFCALGSSSVLASDTAWTRTYPGASQAARSIARDGTGNIIITGHGHRPGGFDLDYTTIKYLPNGDTAWLRYYNSPENVNDYAVAVGTDGEGNIYVTGHSDPGTASPDKKIVTVKYDAIGNLLWTSEYDPPYPPDSNRLAVPVDMFVNGFGYAYIAGHQRGKGTAEDALVIKYYPSGDTAWVRSYGRVNPQYSPYHDSLNAICVDGLGNVYATGSTGYTTSSMILTLAFNSTGNQSWVGVNEIVMPPEFGDDVGNDITVDNGGNAYVAGTAGSYPFSNIVTIKYLPNGDTAWVRRYNAQGVAEIGYGERIALDPLGNVVVGCSGGPNTNTIDLITLKYSTAGELHWFTRTGRAIGQDLLSDMAVAADGWIWMTAASFNAGTNWNWLTVRLNPLGDPTWSDYYIGPGPIEYDTDIPAAIVATDSTHAWVTGLKTTATMGSEFLTIAYQLDCCYGMTGNVDGDPDGLVDISDLSILIDHLFFGFEPLPCFEEADIDNSGAIDISDLSAIIDHIFFTMDFLPECPR
ncbi:MAG: hypothetical protein AB1644_06945 [Candidatus Zixiibacteriota bacterium]